MRFSRDVVLEHKSLVLECLNDEDVTIRVQALELVTGMITRRNIKVIVRKLSLSMESAEGHYRDELVSKIIAICSRDKYADVTDFAWYVGVLKDLANTKSSQFEEKIAQQLMDVTLRVPWCAPLPSRLAAVLTDSGAGGRGGEHSRRGSLDHRRVREQSDASHERDAGAGEASERPRGLRRRESF